MPTEVYLTWQSIVDSIHSDLVVNQQEIQQLRNLDYVYSSIRCFLYDKYPDSLVFQEVRRLFPSSFSDVIVNLIISKCKQVFYSEPFLSFKGNDKAIMLQAESILSKVDDYSKTQILSKKEQDFYLEFAKMVIIGDQQIRNQTKRMYLNEIVGLIHFAEELNQSFETDEELDCKSLNFNEYTSSHVHLIPQDNSTTFRKVDDDRYKPIWLPFSSENKLKEQELPYFKNLQVEIPNMDTLHNSIETGITVAVICPSGIGKTAFIQRNLSQNIGIFTTCTNTNVLKGNADKAAAYFFEIFQRRSQECIIHTYATLRQLIQCLLLAKLITAHICVESWNSSHSKAQPFDSVVEYVAFFQSCDNGNRICFQILQDLIRKNWDKKPIQELREETSAYIKSLTVKVGHDISTAVIFAFDECNLFSCQKTVLFTLIGTPLDLLTVFVREMDEIRFLCGHNISVTDMYCGTMFHSDVRETIRSTIQREEELFTTVETYYGLDLLSFDQAWEMIDLIYNLEKIANKELVRKETKHLFPMRRNIVGSVCAQLPILNFDLIKSFNEIWIEVSKKIQHSIEEGISMGIEIDRRILLEFYLKPKFNQLLYPYVVAEGEVASNIIKSGLGVAEMVDQEFHFFNTSEPLNTHICKGLLGNNQEDLKQNISESVDSLLDLHLSSSEVVWEDMASLIMMRFPNKMIDHPMIQSCHYNKQLFNPILEQYEFNATSFKTSLEFYHFVKDQDWAIDALLAFNVKREQIGDFLYFYCLENENLHHFIDRLMFKPSVSNHADRIYIDTKNRICALFSFTLHRTQDVNQITTQYEQGKEFINYKLFYHNNRFLELDLNPLWRDSFWYLNSLWWPQLKKVHSFFKELEENSRTIKLLLHYHTSPEFLSSNADLPFKIYEESDLFVLKFDPSLLSRCVSSMQWTKIQMFFQSL